jgi:hypothetical protein
MPPLPTTPEAADEEARRIVHEMLALLEPVTAPKARRSERLAEQLSFLQARENFRAFSLLIDADEDVPSAMLARALFEDAMRWAWVDEDPNERAGAFFVEAARAHKLIDEAASVQGIDGAMFFGPLVTKELLPAAVGAGRFPQPFEDLMAAWMGDAKMHYLQYRLLSQYVHSSLLGAASTVVEDGGELRNARKLPYPARLTVIRNAAASMAFIFEETKDGLSWPGAVALNIALFTHTTRVAQITSAFAPGSA